MDIKGVATPSAASSILFLRSDRPVSVGLHCRNGDRGFINVDIQMRTNVPHIFAIGDIVGQPMLAHKAVHEAHVAAEVIAGEQQGNAELAAAAFPLMPA
jgi:pyruvate/2-oxoglutarate dehydrogenase complex dihydrolipoamide dehydrogenase (E3) component